MTVSKLVKKGYKYDMDKVRMLLADDHAIVRAGIRKTIEEIPGLEVVDEVGDGPQVFAAHDRQIVSPGNDI